MSHSCDERRRDSLRVDVFPVEFSGKASQGVKVLSATSPKVSFIYREFYDVPRMIILSRGNLRILLESAFDTEADEYSDTYKVFVLPNISEEDLRGSWEALASTATGLLGEISVNDLDFDTSRRKEINPILIDNLLKLSGLI